MTHPRVPVQAAIAAPVFPEDAAADVDESDEEQDLQV